MCLFGEGFSLFLLADEVLDGSGSGENLARGTG